MKRAEKHFSLSGDGAKVTVIYLRIDDVNLAPGKNPREHPERQLAKLAKSVRTFGFWMPVLVDSNHQLIAGHARVEAARRLGYQYIPAIVAESLTPEQCKALRIADNRISELGAWNMELLAAEIKTLSECDLDFDLDVVGFELPELDILIQGAQPNTDPSEDPADKIPPIVDQPAVSRPGYIWKLSKNLLCNGNALDATPFKELFQNIKAAMSFVDPPYNRPIDEVANFGKIRHRDFVTGSGEMSSDEFIDFLTRSFSRLSENSADGSLHFACCDWRHLREMLTAGFRVYSDLFNLCVWTKNNGGMGGFYRSSHELVLVFKKGRGKHRNNIELGRYGRNRTNVWNYVLPNSNGSSDEAGARRGHPTVKPVAMIADAILDCTSRGDVVVDSFCGSGSTIIAAERVGRRCFAVELDPLYVDLAVRRWQSLTGEKARHAQSGRSFNEMAEEVREVGHGR